eukprot:gene22490-biopygen16254
MNALPARGHARIEKRTQQNLLSSWVNPGGRLFHPCTLPARGAGCATAPPPLLSVCTWGGGVLGPPENQTHPSTHSSPTRHWDRNAVASLFRQAEKHHGLQSLERTLAWGKATGPFRPPRETGRTCGKHPRGETKVEADRTMDRAIEFKEPDADRTWAGCGKRCFSQRVVSQGGFDLCKCGGGKAGVDLCKRMGGSDSSFMKVQNDPGFELCKADSDVVHTPHEVRSNASVVHELGGSRTSHPPPLPQQIRALLELRPRGTGLWSTLQTTVGWVFIPSRDGFVMVSQRLVIASHRSVMVSHRSRSVSHRLLISLRVTPDGLPIIGAARRQRLVSAARRQRLVSAARRQRL